MRCLASTPTRQVQTSSGLKPLACGRDPLWVRDTPLNSVLGIGHRLAHLVTQRYKRTADTSNNWAGAIAIGNLPEDS
jgi:hypothetical protein